MNIQLVLEKAIHKLAHEFIDEPYRFFTEADAVARFHEILDSDPTINKKVQTKDKHLISLIHQEYPTFFRFNDSNPTERLPASSGARRGHYDIVILNPEFVKAHEAETVKNRNIRIERDKSINPFEAVVEFKLDDRGWSVGITKGAIAEMGKLILSRKEIELRYFVSLMRYTAPNMNRWEKYWPQVKQSAKERSDIRSIFATRWISTERESEISSFGNWLLKDSNAS